MLEYESPNGTKVKVGFFGLGIIISVVGYWVSKIISSKKTNGE